MKEGETYGVIPGGGSRPTLLKPGAKKLAFVFRMAASFEMNRDDLADGHRGYEVICTLRNIESEKVLAQGVGYCSSMEGKYRFRSENTGKPVPPEYWETRDFKELGGPQFSTRKVDGKWIIFHKVEHDNPADYFNTILKMAKKRAQVDATLTATACSDIFTQDVEEMRDLIAKDDPDVIDTTTADEQKATDHGKKDEPVNKKQESSNGGSAEGLISEPQVVRFNARAKAKNWNAEELDRLLYEYDVVKPEQLNRGKYKNIIEKIDAGPVPF